MRPSWDSNAWRGDDDGYPYLSEPFGSEAQQLFELEKAAGLLRETLQALVDRTGWTKAQAVYFVDIFRATKFRVYFQTPILMFLFGLLEVRPAKFGDHPVLEWKIDQEVGLAAYRSILIIKAKK